MSKIVVLYWEPGSGGDFVYSTLLARLDEYQGILTNTTINSQGRVVPTLLPFFEENFSHRPEQWYLREWTIDDVQLLSTFAAQSKSCTVIPTHRVDQAKFLQSQIAGSTVVGITYPTNMFPLVLKNWCKKVAANDTELQKIYNKPLHQHLRSKNSFGEFVLYEQLKFGSMISSSVGPAFDVNISLEDLYNKNLTTLNALFQDCSHVSDMFNSWFKHQSILHQVQYNIPAILQKALGYNSAALTTNMLDIELDQFDNILIKHQNSPNKTPNFKTLQQAADFFKS